MLLRRACLTSGGVWVAWSIAPVCVPPLRVVGGGCGGCGGDAGGLMGGGSIPGGGDIAPRGGSAGESWGDMMAQSVATAARLPLGLPAGYSRRRGGPP